MKNFTVPLNVANACAPIFSTSQNSNSCNTVVTALRDKIWIFLSSFTTTPFVCSPNNDEIRYSFGLSCKLHVPIERLGHGTTKKDLYEFFFP